MIAEIGTAQPIEPAQPDTGGQNTFNPDITFRVPVEADWGGVYRVLSTAFNEDVDDTITDIERSVWEPTRSLIAERDGDIVGTAAISSRQMCVPGSMLPTAHITLVSVAPTARRRGILSTFMRQQFDDIRAVGEPIAALWASEGRIYQRYGFGLAARKLALTIESREVELPVLGAGSGRLREGAPADFLPVLRLIYDKTYSHRPGWSERADQHWAYRLADPQAWRRGSSSLRAAVHEGASGPDGYVLWRVNAKWGENGAAGEVKVMELVAENPPAYLALWRFLLSLDLTRSVEYWTGAVDEPLLFLVTEPRRLSARLADSLWVRVLDVPAALSARRYAAPLDVVIEITDKLVPANAGRWRLIGSPDGAICSATTDPADLSCDIAALASAYLGDYRFGALGLAGLVTEHRPGALAAANAAFGWHTAPSALEVF